MENMKQAEIFKTCGYKKLSFFHFIKIKVSIKTKNINKFNLFQWDLIRLSLQRLDPNRYPDGIERRF